MPVCQYFIQANNCTLGLDQLLELIMPRQNEKSMINKNQTDTSSWIGGDKHWLDLK